MGAMPKQMVIAVGLAAVAGIAAVVGIAALIQPGHAYVTISGDGYVVDVPEGWIYQPDDAFFGILVDALFGVLTGGIYDETVGSSVMRTYADPQSVREDDFPTQIAASTTPTTLTRSGYDEFNADVYAALGLLGADVRYADRQSVVLGGQPGTLTEYVIVSEASRVLVIHATTVVSGVAYEVMYMAEEAKYDAGLPHFERAVQSFRIAGR